MAGYVRRWSKPIFARLKEHYCLKCGERINLCTQRKEIDAASKEARKNFGKEPDYFAIDGGLYRIETITLVWDEFCCPKCGFTISIKDQWRAEKAARKKGNRQTKV